MVRISFTVVCVAAIGASCLAQNKPTLRRDGPAKRGIHGNIEGFSVTHPVWPTVKTNLPNGTKVTLTALVAHGRVVQVSIENADAHAKNIGALEAALKKWRFAMPSDGTSPVRSSVSWEARDGKFAVGDVAVSIADAR